MFSFYIGELQLTYLPWENLLSPKDTEVTQQYHNNTIIRLTSLSFVFFLFSKRFAENGAILNSSNSENTIESAIYIVGELKR